ncbi:unnamed protein product [Ranitomeya imitator]|uniref:Sulfotransferase n=1 Tax=Ranitomeya imitator TaxID=111125 RepID=A0ABN9M1G9_9NEOB|nr:unnamed protein product [Ranitomeya imitator]
MTLETKMQKNKKLQNKKQKNIKHKTKDQSKRYYLNYKQKKTMQCMGQEQNSRSQERRRRTPKLVSVFSFCSPETGYSVPVASLSPPLWGIRLELELRGPAHLFPPHWDGRYLSFHKPPFVVQQPDVGKEKLNPGIYHLSFTAGRRSQSVREAEGEERDQTPECNEDITGSVSHTPIQRCHREIQRRNKVLDFPQRPTISQQGPDRNLFITMEYETVNYMDFEDIRVPQGVHTKESLIYAWKEFETRDDDVFNVTYPKSGTTWLQEILSLIYSNGDPTPIKTTYSWDRVPWIEQHGGRAQIENRPSPRLITTHLPFHLFPQSFAKSKAKVIYTIRNPKDVCVSLYYFSKIAQFMESREDFQDFVSLFLSKDSKYIMSICHCPFF